MPDRPKTVPYIVVLSFGAGGPLVANALLAPSEAEAVALATVETMRSLPPIDMPLQGVLCVPINPEFIGAAQKALRGEDVAGQVVSLVPPTTKTFWQTCQLHGTVPVEGCPYCSPPTGTAA